MTLKVFVLTRNSTLAVEELKPLLPASINLSHGEKVPDDGDFEILIHGTPSRMEIEVSPNLRSVIAPFAGAPKETIELLRDYPHISLHSVHFNVAATAELAIGLMIGIAKLIVPLDRELRSNDWRSRYGKTSVIILDGRRVTVLGYGRIGKRIGDACRALGMKVTGIRRHVAGDVEVDGDNDTPVYPPSAIAELLPCSDVLIVALPLTAETEGILGKNELELLPADAILVNVGRGPIIDEEALFEMLKSKRILGAGIDVWYQYPQTTEERTTMSPSRFPFHTLDNVVMSPHRGGFLSAAEGNRIQELASLLTAAAEGKTIPGAVDKELGY